MIFSCLEGEIPSADKWVRDSWSGSSKTGSCSVVVLKKNGSVSSFWCIENLRCLEIESCRKWGEGELVLIVMRHEDSSIWGSVVCCLSSLVILTGAPKLTLPRLVEFKGASKWSITGSALFTITACSILLIMRYCFFFSTMETGGCFMPWLIFPIASRIFRFSIVSL